MVDGVTGVERIVSARYAELPDDARRAWSAVGINVRVNANLEFVLTDDTNPTLRYATVRGGMYFGLSCYLQELLDAPDADASQIRHSLISAL
ncbi:hypothetical protein [Microbacterium testaceum]|uniref:hypothetical protein n=1 Tax=Microbacterium testaceum TaxID=2033 RepID=UPI001247F135|nr:hypothetical protein [Microbacterium testaceum]